MYMSITLFGTCRINNVINNNNLHDMVNYTHSTKEVIQQIKFLKGEIAIPPPFDTLCFRTGITNNKGILYNPELSAKFMDSTLCIIEICSNKKYMYNNYYLHHLCVDKRFSKWNANTPSEIMQGHTCVLQTEDEIESDILEIKKLIEPRKMILVTHYNSKMNDKYILARNNLVILLSKIALIHTIPLINPTEVLKDYKQEDVMDKDLGHYTQLGLNKFSDYLNNYIKDYL